MNSSIPEPAIEVAIWGGEERERDSLSYFTTPQLGEWLITLFSTLLSRF